MDQIVHKVLRFDRFALDLTRGHLRNGEQEIRLRPKAFQVLTYLALNAGWCRRRNSSMPCGPAWW